MRRVFKCNLIVVYTCQIATLRVNGVSVHVVGVSCWLRYLKQVLPTGLHSTVRDFGVTAHRIIGSPLFDERQFEKMKIEKVKCDICEKEFRKDKPMAYLRIILHTRPIGLENDNGYMFDICDSCGRKYEKALDDIIEEANQKILQMRISTK